ncbi:MAG: [acyl-carrier-protein] S-malonyltransferase [Betaproteobacteria bacterium]|nr:[acyl-carrier-protein] S-malonyltransferase [Betaproteobacteria bacterium]
MNQTLAFMFPGQGSQSVGMLAGFAGNPVVDRTLVAASAALGQDLAALIAEGPAEALSLTVNTQPVMLACGLAFYRAYEESGGPRPAFMVGHSLGEYTALAAAGVFAPDDAVRAVRFRAEQMQAAVPAGTAGMAAIIGLEAQVVVETCKQRSKADAVVEAVNFNAPDQTVIAGHLGAVEAACAALKEQGAKRALMLPVSAPFHSTLLSPAAHALRDYLAGLTMQPPSCTVVHNVDVCSHASVAQIREALALQAMSPVRWVETLQSLEQRGVTTLVECGPGKVLAGLARRVVPTLTVLGIHDQDSLLATLEALQ